MEALNELLNSQLDDNVQNEENNKTDSIAALQAAQTGLNQVSRDLSLSVQLVEALLDFDLAPREFLVKPSFNEELTEIRKELDEVDTELEHIHSKMDNLWCDISGQNPGSVRLESDKGKDASCAWYFRLPNANDSKMLQDKLKNKVTVHKLLKNGVHFSTKQ